jgi:hypothetical protein
MAVSLINLYRLAPLKKTEADWRQRFEIHQNMPHWVVNL